MSTKLSVADATRLVTDAERSALGTLDAEPIAEPVLADAEEQEIAELWAGDPGNQGA